MTNREETLIKGIRARYEAKETTKLDELKALDKRVNNPAHVFAYVFGTVGALVLGVGMCLAMQIIGGLVMFGMSVDMVAGVVIGLVGIAMVSTNYFIHTALLEKRRRKYAEQIIALSNTILEGN